MLTLTELKEWVAANYDECTILDILEINSYDLVELLSDQIEEKMDRLITEMELLKDDSYDDR